ARRWGDDWIVFPNPIYGAWRSSLQRPDGSPAGDEQPPSPYQPEPVRPSLNEAPKMSLLSKWQG
ncbi:MAG: hypothetical protein KIS61_24265, partial [Candidatus Eremiobacteraeota bacterium]|nr:hypothetical protein [Candidatus Eremiobacteraeota bacterium]